MQSESAQSDDHNEPLEAQPHDGEGEQIEQQPHDSSQDDEGYDYRDRLGNLQKISPDLKGYLDDDDDEILLDEDDFENFRQ